MGFRAPGKVRKGERITQERYCFLQFTISIINFREESCSCGLSEMFHLFNLDIWIIQFGAHWTSCAIQLPRRTNETCLSIGVKVIVTEGTQVEGCACLFLLNFPITVEYRLTG